MTHFPFAPANPYSSIRLPVFARNVVSTSHPLAAQVGLRILQQGGNAVDAAVAALFTLTVVEPMMVGVLGGGFAHIRLPDGRQTILEGQGRCPAGVGPTTFTQSRLERAHVVGQFPETYTHAPDVPALVRS